MRFIYAKGKYISGNTNLSVAFRKHDLTRDTETGENLTVNLEKTET